MSSSFTLLSFLITLLLAAPICIQGQETVKDTNGNPVEVGKKYFIELLSNYGGSLIPYPLDPLDFFSICPLRITLQPEFLGGPPVSFAFVWSGTNQTIVDTYSDVTIEFKPDNWPLCSDHTKFWEYEESSSEPKILVGGNPKRTNCWFKIKETDSNIYELTTSTGTIGVKPGGWFSLSELVLTNDASKTLLVKFRKADGATTATTSTSRVEKISLRLAME